MARSQPISVGRFEFKSKAAAIAHISGRLNSYQPGDRVSSIDDLELLDSLVDMHLDPERKRGAGIAYWSVERNAQHNQGRALGFYLHRADGTFDDFGYQKVINKPSNQYVVREALANCVREQQQAFRREAFANPPVRDECDGTLIECADDAKVIHHEPTWGAICDEAVSEFGGYDAIKVESRAGYYGKYPANAQVESVIRRLQDKYLSGLRIVRNRAPKP